MQNLKEKIKNWWQKIKSIMGLSLQVAIAEFKLRNEGSYLGILWYLLNPILMFALLFFIFSDRIGNNIPYYYLYLFLGIIMFNFFQNTTSEATKSIIQVHNTLIKSVNFPKESLIISIVIKNLFSHMFELLFFILIASFKINILSVIFYVPILALFLIFTFGFSLLLSLLTVYFVDLDNIWNFAIRIIWLATPIFYAIEGQTRLFYLNLFNPLYYFIALARDSIIYGKMPESWIFLGVFGFSFFVFFAALFVFRKLKNKIPELI